MNSRVNIDPVKLKAKRMKCEDEHLFFTRAFFKPRMGFKFSVNWHHEYVAWAIDEVIAGRIENLVINVPPGSGKTELLTNLIPRGIARNQRSRFLYLSFSQSLVEDVSSTARNIVKSADFQGLWPVKISTNTDAKASWKTTVDGYEAGHVYSASMGGQVTGRRAGTLADNGFTGAIILDDPLKPEDAFSKTARNKANRKILNTVNSRKAKSSTPIILIMQRLHVEDPTNFVMTGNVPGKWHQISIPALIDDDYIERLPEHIRKKVPLDVERDEKGRQSYWPLKESLQSLLQLEKGGQDKDGATVSRYTFSSQYQQEPKKLGGDLIKAEWFGEYHELPELLWRAVFVDTAQKIKEQNDFTVFTLVGMGVDGKLYRKHPVQPWPEPEIPEYEGTGDLEFVCLCDEPDAHNVVLNFGADDCIPGIPNRNWWYILNRLSVTRLDNGVEIEVYDGNYSTDRSCWCWSYTLTVPASQIGKLEPINGQPVILKITVNGTEHQMLLENRRRSRKFAQDTYTLIGRSQTALLAAPTAPLRSFLQENDRTSVQLCQAELDRVFSNTVLNWRLIDTLGWIVEHECLSYSNLAPIDAIKMVVESGGGFIYSEKGSNTLTIKPLYKKTFWDVLSIAEYDRLLPESAVVSQSTDYQIYPDYNGITLTNDRKALVAQVKRTETSADTLLQSENNPLFNHVNMGAYGKAKLAKAGMVETHTYSMPISPVVGECVPGEVLAFNAEWWGIVDSVSVSFSHAVVNQTVKVERVNRE